MTAALHLVGSRPLVPLRFSRLKRIGQSPQHYAHALDVPETETKSLRMGRAVDALVFGTSKVVPYDGQRRGKAWEAFAQANASAICLNKAEWEQVAGMARALEDRPDALDLLSGNRQQTIRWTFSGRECEGTPDAFTDTRLADLKTTRTAHPERFIWEARRYAYHAAADWYGGGLLLSGRQKPRESFLVAVESIAPHPITVFALTDRALEQGARLWRLWFERLRACEESDAWPGYAESVVPFDLPDEDPLVLKIDGEELDVE